VIRFDLDSARLQEPSKPLLDNLIVAMKSDRLSQSRAQSVATYLSAHCIDSQRLGAKGKGFSELLLPQKPHAAEYHRVIITALP
jgi:outer membrane protein OmpA-like peptidoglycan-associated protein